jgi:hypothetical protein
MDARTTVKVRSLWAVMEDVREICSTFELKGGIHDGMVILLLLLLRRRFS